MGGRGCKYPMCVRESSGNWDRTARRREGYQNSQRKVFPTRTNMAGKTRTRGKGRGGRNKWHYPKKGEVLAEQRKWLERRKAEGASREVVKGQIWHAGRSPNYPPVKKALDSIFGK